MPENRNLIQKPEQQNNNLAAAGPSTGIMLTPGQQGKRGAPQQAQHPQPQNKQNKQNRYIIWRKGEIDFFTCSVTLH